LIYTIHGAQKARSEQTVEYCRREQSNRRKADYSILTE
jgi:hypothetical protein